MTTVVLGFLIIIGAVLVFLVRYYMNRSQMADDEAEDLRDSTRKLQMELERSADEIIRRIDSHVERLEKLINKADEQSALLDERIATIKALPSATPFPSQASQPVPNDLGMANFSSLLTNTLARDGATVPPVATEPLKQAPPASMPTTPLPVRTARAATAPARQPTAQPHTPNQLTAQSLATASNKPVTRHRGKVYHPLTLPNDTLPSQQPAPQPVPPKPDEARVGPIKQNNPTESEAIREALRRGGHSALPPEARDNAEMKSRQEVELRKAMANEPEPDLADDYDEDETEVIETTKEREKMPEPAREPHGANDGPSPAAKVRGLLINGYSDEEISRETGMGIRAIELIKQMSRNNMAD